MSAILAQALGFLISAIRLRRLAGPTVSLSFPAATGLELVMNGLAVLGPAAPAEGLAYGTRQLRRRGLDKTRTALVLVLEQWFSYRVIYLVAALNILVLIARRDFPVPGAWPVLGAFSVLLALLGTAVLARNPASTEHLSGVWARVRFWKPPPSVEERRLAALRLYDVTMRVVGRPRDRLWLVGLSVAGHLCGVLTLLLAMRAVGLSVDLDVILLAAAAAVLASSIPLLPGGLGVVEAVVPAVLHWYGAPLGQALAGAIVARIVNTVLPAVSGAVALWVLELSHLQRASVE